MDKVFERTIQVVIFLLFAYGEVIGIYHSFSKHRKDDDMYSIYMPPFAWYRSVEFLWHDDFAGVNWETRLKDDSKACIYILAQYTGEEGSKPEFLRSVENFSGEVNKYPKEKIEVLKNCSQVYIAFDISLLQDLKNAYRDAISGTPKLSDRTEHLASKLRDMGFKDEMELTESAAQKMLVFAQNEALEDDLTLGKEKVDNLNSIISIQENKLTEAYKRLFNEVLTSSEL